MKSRFEVTGWIIFLVCSGLFITQNLRTSDTWGIIASIVFLVGCLTFLAPYVLERQRPPR